MEARINGSRRAVHPLLDNAFHSEWPFKRGHRLAPQARIRPFAGIGRVGDGPALAPDAQDPGVGQVDSAAPIQAIETFYDIIGLAWPRRRAPVCAKPGGVAACGECSHRPEPGLFGGPERDRSEPLPGGRSGHKVSFPRDRMRHRSVSPCNRSRNSVELPIQRVTYDCTS